MGVDYDKNGIGEPVATYKKPDVGGSLPKMTPPESDEFNSPHAWLAMAVARKPATNLGFSYRKLGYYRMNCIPETRQFCQSVDSTKPTFTKISG